MATKAFWSVFAVIAALTMTLAASAFQSKENTEQQPLDYYFEFNPLLSPTEPNVEDPANWVQVADAGTCDQDLIRPCRIKVAASATVDHGSGNPRTLKSTASIVASPSSGGMYYVTQTGDVQAAYNQSN